MVENDLECDFIGEKLVVAQLENAELFKQMPYVSAKGKYGKIRRIV